MPENYEAAKDGLLSVMLGWERDVKPESQAHVVTEPTSQTFPEWLGQRQTEGWTRGAIYHLIWDVLRDYDSAFTPMTMDELGEVETALTGFCHPDSIIRFPGDPEDPEALSAYVLGNTWRRG